MYILNIDEILKIAVPMIKQFEGLKLKPYLDCVGVPTIGYGSTYYVNGIKVTLKDPEISIEQASDILRATIAGTYLPAVLSLCPTLERETQAAAILDWTYNLGTGNLRGSTMRKRILNLDWQSVPAEILKWNIAGGRINAGLTRRRRAEANLFIS
jgi:lysozyme